MRRHFSSVVAPGTRADDADAEERRVDTCQRGVDGRDRAVKDRPEPFVGLDHERANGSSDGSPPVEI